ncbi:MAG: hypothetical protein AAF870_06885 [Pseudomonadota bacterium]
MAYDKYWLHIFLEQLRIYLSTHLRAIARALLPPLIASPLKRIFSPAQVEEKEELLFDGDNEMFLECVGNAKNYAEFGCGLSSKWVAKETDANMICVDTSSEWIERTEKDVPLGRAKFIHVDCGVLGAWGKPVDFSRRNSFIDYPNAIWDRPPLEPYDVILIDGRFRVVCFLTCLIKAKPGTVVIFDDYINRPQYHIVEEFVRLSERCGRQAKFIVPDQKEIDPIEIQALIEKFEYVMD